MVKNGEAKHGLKTTNFKYVVVVSLVKAYRSFSSCLLNVNAVF